MATTPTDERPTGAGWGATIRATGLALALATGPGLAACSDDSPTDPAGEAVTSTTVDPTAPSDPAPVRLRAGTRAAWTCPATATVSPPAEITCLRITVPEDPAATDGPTVDLPVAVITRPDQQDTVPVVYLDGGPGGDGLGMAPYLADLPLARTRPVVIVGQRGTPFAEPSFDCPEAESAAIEGLDAVIDETSAATWRAALRTCFERTAATGVAFETYDTQHAADDVEAVRLTLGHDTWHVYGVSYGTRLALEVARRHPGSVTSLVLDSVYPPEVESYATLVPGLAGAVDELEAACEADPVCPPIGHDLGARIGALHAELEARPVDVEAPDPVTGEPVTVRWDGTRLAQVVFLSLYSEITIPLLPGVIAAGERGDLGLASVIYLRQQGSSLEGLAEGLYLAVECRERAPFSDPAEVDRVAVEAPPWLADAVTAETDLDDCDPWEAPPAEAPGQPVTLPVPTLVLAGRFDPVTPPSWSRATADRLSGSTFALVRTGGHGVSLDACGAGLAASFLDDPGARIDTSCAASEGIAWAPA